MQLVDFFSQSSPSRAGILVTGVVTCVLMLPVQSHAGIPDVDLVKNKIGALDDHVGLAQSEPWFERLPVVKQDTVYNFSVAIIKTIRNVVGYTPVTLASAEKAIARSE